jgi:hypothetical protein
MRYVYATLATALLIAGCSSTESDATATTSPPETIATTSTSTTVAATTTVTTTSPTTTTTAGIDEGCADATHALIGALAAILDRIDADPDAVIEAADEIEGLFGELGTLLGTECDTDSAGVAISEVITFLAEEATVRSAVGRVYVEALLPGFCGFDFLEYTIAARTVCLTL